MWTVNHFDGVELSIATILSKLGLSIVVNTTASEHSPTAFGCFCLLQDDMAARLRSVLSLAGIPQEGFPVKVGC